MDQMAERVRGLSSRLEARMTEMVEAEQTLSRLVQELDESTEGVLREIGEEFGKLRQMLDRSWRPRLASCASRSASCCRIRWIV